MSVDIFLAARRIEVRVGPMARLALWDIGNNFNHPGPWYRDFARWCSIGTLQPLETAAEGIRELEAHNLLWTDPQDVDKDGAPAVWLSFVPGWEDEWAEQLFLRHPPQRKPIPAALRTAVMARDGGTCRACGTTRNPSIDHIHPVSRGGMTVLANLQVLCRSCNSRKATSLRHGAAA